MELHLRWASETGHSLDLLREFAEECKERKIAISSLGPLDSETDFRKGIYILFISTTGQGAPPFSMRPLWKNMMKKNYKIGDGVKFAIYSLGDRGYLDNFAMAARKMRQRLRMLGAEQLVEIGLGDDQESQGYRQVYLSGWAENLLKTIKGQVIQGGSLDIPVNLRNLEKESCFQLKQVRELSARKGRKVLWVQLQVQGPQVHEGDVLEIFPHNRREEVDYMLKHFQRGEDQKVVFLGKTLTIKQVLTEYANVSSVLNYYFFSNASKQDIVKSAHNQPHRQKIRQFCQDYEEFYNFIVKYKRNIVQFLKDFDIKLYLQYFLKFIGQVVGRKYSVARVKGNRVWLLVKLVQQQITQGRFYKGLCSHDFLEKGAKRKGRVLRGDIVPEELQKNNLIVTLGTGIAPFIWVIDRLSGEGSSKALLLYTNSFQDEIFHRKLCQVTNLQQIVSYTREGGEKIIRLIESNIKVISQFLLQGNSRVFYCGPKQIQDFLLRCISNIFSVSPDEIVKKKLIVCQNW